MGIREDLGEVYFLGNKLIAVNDEVSVHNNDDFFDNGMVQHPDNSDFTPEYEYDRNGNLICDKNKSMYISYNHLNLPVTVDFGNGNRIEWVYDAGGAKLRKTVFHENEESYFQDYLGGISWRTTFTDGIGVRELEYIAHDEGKIKHNDNGFYYVYDYKDHLGNVRLSFTKDSSGDTNIVQEDHYYPFGMRLAALSINSGNDNKHLYNGKELEEDFNLQWYHYGARYYDPQLGRWHAVDPADEFHSPYVYCGNMPIIAVDPDGRDMYIANDNTINEQSFIYWMSTGQHDQVLFGSDGKVTLGDSFDPKVSPEAALLHTIVNDKSVNMTYSAADNFDKTYGNSVINGTIIQQVHNSVHVEVFDSSGNSLSSSQKASFAHNEILVGVSAKAQYTDKYGKVLDNSKVAAHEVAEAYIIHTQNVPRYSFINGANNLLPNCAHEMAKKMLPKAIYEVYNAKLLP